MKQGDNFLFNKSIMLAVIVAMFVVCRKVWHMDFPIKETDFPNITLGMATANNIDMQQLIIWYVLHAVVLSFIFACIFHRLGYYEKIIAKLKSISLPDNENYFLGTVILGQILLGSRSWLAWSFIISMGLAWLYLLKINPKADKKHILSVWITAMLSFIIPCLYVGSWLGNINIFVLFNLLFLLWLCHNATDEHFLTRIHAKLFPFTLAAIAAYLILAVMEVSLVRGFDVIDVLALLPFLIAVAYLCFSRGQKNRDYTKKNFYGTLILLILSYLPALGNEGYVETFEGANHGVSIEELILGTGIPILQNLDAHLLSNVLPGIIYYKLTGDYTGALFIPYEAITIAALGIISLTYLFKQFFSKQEILIVLMIFPWSLSFYSFAGLISLAFLIYWLRKPGVYRSVLLMAAFTALCLYRIDLGVSFGGALILCPLIYCAGHRNYGAMGKYVLSGAVWFLLFGLCLYHITLSYNLNPLVVIKEFLTAFSSSQHWGYGVLGEFHNVLWFYFLLPVVITVMIWPYILRARNGNENPHDWVLLFLFGCYIFNIPRTLVIHTLVEQEFCSFDIALMLCALLLISIWAKQRISIFLVIFLAGSVSIIGINNIGINRWAGDNFINVTRHRNMGVMTDYPMNTEALIRSVHANEHSYAIICDDDMRQIRAYLEFFSENLTDEETYFDFTNQSLFYAFTQRKNPIYINQCPGMINGYQGQKQAISSLERSKTKFVIMPYRPRSGGVNYFNIVELSGLLNVDRYYLLTDYITENYRPYCAVGDFAVWCLKSEYTTLCKRDKENSIEREYLDYTYAPMEHHKHYLGAIPELWGNCDMGNVASESLPPIGDKRYLLPKDVLGHNGFIVLELEASYGTDCEIRLHGKEISPVEYHFRVEKGLHRYRLQVSSDILWYADKLEEVNVVTTDVQIKNVYFEPITRN